MDAESIVSKVGLERLPRQSCLHKQAAVPNNPQPSLHSASVHNEALPDLPAVCRACDGDRPSRKCSPCCTASKLTATHWQIVRQSGGWAANSDSVEQPSS